MSKSQKRSVLITGCSDGGIGAALAVAFHEAGLHVYATARNPANMTKLASLGIETSALDVLDDTSTSIANCVSNLPSLDILVNNAGANYNMPVADLIIAKSKELFDLNVWSYIAVSKAFLPLLKASSTGGMIVNQTSISSVITLLYQGTYCASKAAMAMFTSIMRLELEAFNIKVVDLRTGVVKSDLSQNAKEATDQSLPENSLYAPAKEIIDPQL